MLTLVDAVSVVVPTVTHLPVASEFLNQGIPVLVEKPLAPTVTEARELAGHEHRGVIGDHPRGRPSRTTTSTPEGIHWNDARAGVICARSILRLKLAGRKWAPCSRVSPPGTRRYRNGYLPCSDGCGSKTTRASPFRDTTGRNGLELTWQRGSPQCAELESRLF